MRLQHFLPFALLSLTLAFPLLSHKHQSQLSHQTYDQISISAGTAGNAQAEAMARFPIDLSNLASISPDDLKAIKVLKDWAEKAESQAFDPAIQRTSDETIRTELTNGKIKNKILSVTGAILLLQIEQAQGKDISDQIGTEQSKLETNVQLDQSASGQASRAVSFKG